ncbi:MAG TPA: chemotaxis protein CheB [Cytophagaceae bacterium]
MVKEGEEKEPIREGYVYFAPPDYHMLVDYDETISLSKDEKVNFSRPSIDVLFESAADVFGSSLIGIILTGSSSDGANGLLKIKKNGGLTIVQSPEEAEYRLMPEAALKLSGTQNVFTLEEIVRFLLQYS